MKAAVVLLALLFTVPAFAPVQWNDLTKRMSDQSSLLEPYHLDRYGPGEHSDATGRRFHWKTQNTNKRVSPFTRVKPDAYGLGVGKDQYGRPVIVSPLDSR